jgi:hypothetical protein
MILKAYVGELEVNIKNCIHNRVLSSVTLAVTTGQHADGMAQRVAGGPTPGLDRPFEPPAKSL